MSINLLLFKITLLLYSASTVVYLADVVSRRFKGADAARWLLIGGFAIHCATLVVRYFEAGYTPVANLHESLSFFAWTIIGVYLLFDFKYRLPVLGAFACPMALALMLAGSAVPSGPSEVAPILQSWWFPIHVTFAFLGHAVFAVAFMAGIMYLLQERMLKSKKLSGLYYRLPSLDILDSINYRCLTIGFPLMTLGIVTGAVWANSAWGGYWRWDPKETWALVTWLLYAALLHGRLTVGWRGRRAAIFAIIGFSFLLFTFLGVNLLLSDLHSFEAMEGGGR